MFQSEATTNGHSHSDIPIVDFARWKRGSAREERLKVAKDLVAACREVGFVYIINHGVPKETLDRAFELTKQLYDLPKEDKMKAPHPPGWAHHRGYSWPGLEKVSAALSQKDDEKMVEQLREVTDCKVCNPLSIPPSSHKCYVKGILNSFAMPGKLRNRFR